MQSRYSDDDGDCLRACIASIFNVEPEQLSDFRTTNWWDNARAWVRGHTAGHLDLCWARPHYPLYDAPATHPAIAVTTNHTGATHATLVDPDNGQLIHDPMSLDSKTTRPALFLIAVTTPDEADARSHLWRDPTLARWFPATLPNPATPSTT